MCAYCFVGDHAFKYDPPWDQGVLGVPVSPFIPAQITPTPIVPWSLDRLIEYRDILKEIKALEDQLQCPCEPNKANYIKLFEERIEQIKNADGQKVVPTGPATSALLTHQYCHCSLCTSANLDTFTNITTGTSTVSNGTLTGYSATTPTGAK